MVEKYPVFVDSRFAGFKTPDEIKEIRKTALESAQETKKVYLTDHIVYGYTMYDKNGETDSFHFYKGYSMSDEEFVRVQSIENAIIYAIH